MDTAYYSTLALLCWLLFGRYAVPIVVTSLVYWNHQKAVARVQEVSLKTPEARRAMARMEVELAAGANSVMAGAKLGALVNRDSRTPTAMVLKMYGRLWRLRSPWPKGKLVRSILFSACWPVTMVVQYRALRDSFERVAKKLG